MKMYLLKSLGVFSFGIRQTVTDLKISKQLFKKKVGNLRIPLELYREGMKIKILQKNKDKPDFRSAYPFVKHKILIY
jgi:hypothetical protein